MNDVNQNKPATIRVVFTDIRSVPTQTGTAFVVCKVGGHKCKLFGDVARLILANQDQYHGQETKVYGRWDVKRGNEFVIDSFHTQHVQPSPVVLQTPVSEARQGSTRLHWDTKRIGSDEKARRVGEWLNDFFDSLTEEKRRQWQMPKYKRLGLFPASEDEVQVRRTWKDTNQSPPDLPQDLESVKVRFNARLDLIRENLRRRTGAQASLTASRPPATAIPAEPPPPEEKLSMESAL
jgi:hypothetical protein